MIIFYFYGQTRDGSFHHGESLHSLDLPEICPFTDAPKGRFCIDDFCAGDGADPVVKQERGQGRGIAQ